MSVFFFSKNDVNMSWLILVFVKIDVKEVTKSSIFEKLMLTN